MISLSLLYSKIILIILFFACKFKPKFLKPKKGSFEAIQIYGKNGVAVSLMVRSQLRDRRVLDCTKDPQCVWPWCTSKIKRPLSGVVWMGRSLLRCHPRHLLTVQKLDLCSKIVLVLLQNGTSI
ncbi:hypothetical protein AVEN_230999-1 [Araneus ventricosus]|uniref:Uncharacterized protein n=1 Tax=Araneus ventricosus TaxID=182803 RepID=A0A4Y2A3U7_ARAVE|nr:hypothetical protein AVEN_230999-1 [Araneus ventricosus]